MKYGGNTINLKSEMYLRNKERSGKPAVLSQSHSTNCGVRQGEWTLGLGSESCHLKLKLKETCSALLSSFAVFSK